MKTPAIFNKPVKFTTKKLSKNIFYLEFETAKDAASTLLRFQERYESPYVRGSNFTISSFIDIYKTVTGNNKFTYLSDWGGFNFPSYILKPFITGKMGELTIREKAILNKFKKETKHFYLIATYKQKDKKDFNLTKKHELAHAFYCLDLSYRLKVCEILRKVKLKPIYNILGEFYHRSVWHDEAHAWLLTEMDLLEEHGLKLASYLDAKYALEKLWEKTLTKTMKKR